MRTATPPVDVDPYRRLAADLVADAVKSIRSPAPKQGAKESAQDFRFRHNAWRRQRDADRKWFLDAKKSARWIEIAGSSWEAVVSRMTAKGWLPTAKVA